MRNEIAWAGAVDITFASRRLQQAFNSGKELNRQYGQRMARIIMTRMAVLDGAVNLAMVPVQRPVRRHQLSQDRDEQFAVDLVHPKRLVFEPDHDPIPRLEDGGIDLEAVTAIRIMEVVDYH